MNRMGHELEWAITGGEEDDQSLAPEDFVWCAEYPSRSRTLRVPSLQWVSDFSEADLMAYRLALAMNQPLGSA